MGAVSGKATSWRSSKRRRKFAFVQGQARLADMGFLVRNSPGLMCMRASLRSGFHQIRRKLSERPVPAGAKATDGKLIRHVPASPVAWNLGKGRRAYWAIFGSSCPSCQWMHCTQQMLVPFMDACLINNGALDIQITSPSDPSTANGRSTIKTVSLRQ